VRRRNPARCPRAAWLVAWVAALGLGGCAAPEPGPVVLKDLQGRSIEVPPPSTPPPPPRGPDAAAAYRDALANIGEPLRRAAMRRLADMEMQRLDARQAAEGEVPAADWGAVIARYEAFLAAYPRDPGNDLVLYQLARAHEQSGALEAALAALTRLVEQHPASRSINEAQFRRGELLFTLRDYDRAETAFAASVATGEATPYFERSLYMHGWSLFKQGRVELAAPSFFRLLDRKLAGAGDVALADWAGLTRADRELVEDTFRVTTLCLENMQGVASIPAFITTPVRRGYAHRVYEQMAELYLRQERPKDAADALAAFAASQPLHPQAPAFQARVIEIHDRGGFATLALQARKDYIVRYATAAPSDPAQAAAWSRAQPFVKTHLEDLARQYHAAAQKSRASQDYQEAARWYRALLTAFPDDAQVPQNTFLLGELLFEDGRHAEAAVEYEKVAYALPAQPRSADAGYSALLAYAQLERRAAAEARSGLQRTSIASAQRFSGRFADDPRRAAVMTDAADKLFALGEIDAAGRLAQQVVALPPTASGPAPTAAQRQVAWTVLAHGAFEQGRFVEAERGYRQVLGLLPERDAGRAAVSERLAAAIYKQGEAARSAGDLRAAAGHFARVGEAAPATPARAAAQIDQAAALILLKDWPAAARVLEDFRQRFPRDPRQVDTAGRLAVVYREQGEWARAATEFERVAAGSADPQIAREGLWLAAEMNEKAAARAAAARLYERYLKQYPQPLEAAVEARFRLATLARQDNNPARALALMAEVQKADRAAGPARTARTRELGAQAALALAQPVADEYRRLALVEPLQQSLRNKRARFERALKAYADAAEYGVAEVSTAATFHTAELYRDFGRALLASQRPRGLSKDEREQYDVLLEEQAFPFEEKALEIHEINVARAAQGVYDRSVRDSFAALAKLRPARYAKTERGDGAIDAIR
jgi:TolA-binding protein